MVKCIHCEIYVCVYTYMGLKVALVVKNPPANAGDARDVGLIRGLGRFPVRGHGNPLQYSFFFFNRSGNPFLKRIYLFGCTRS